MSQKTWKLVWQDEFNGPKIDLANWQLDVGYTGESNAEMEIYTPRPKNVFLKDGCLVIAALEENYRGYRYTSARLTTRGLHSWTYGRIEARLKIPFGQGLWPAFWMLGDNIPTIGWPECGEIDIMENIGKLPDTVRGTLHGPSCFRDDGIWADYILNGQRFADDFHVFAVEWEPGGIRWFVDNIHYSTITPQDVPGKWVFDHPFFIILNVAVGGFWPGYPDATTQFPQYMLVDYVRVYSQGGYS
jgi:beta-glucanase (GH16 family)